MLSRRRYASQARHDSDRSVSWCVSRDVNRNLFGATPPGDSRLVFHSSDIAPVPLLWPRGDLFRKSQRYAPAALTEGAASGDGFFK